VESHLSSSTPSRLGSENFAFYVLFFRVFGPGPHTYSNKAMVLRPQFVEITGNIGLDDVRIMCHRISVIPNSNQLQDLKSFLGR